MAKKKTDIYEQQKQRYWLAHTQAPLIKEKFPKVVSLLIDMTFQEPDWGENPSPEKQAFEPNSKAFFNMECPHYECISWGGSISPLRYQS